MTLTGRTMGLGRIGRAPCWGGASLVSRPRFICVVELFHSGAYGAVAREEHFETERRDRGPLAVRLDRVAARRRA